MRTRTKLSFAIPIVLMAVMLSANIAADANLPDPAGGTVTPIQHLVVIFDENTSFDHYFGTYPNAANPANEPSFTPAPDTPSVVGLTGALLTENPNAVSANNPAYNPARLDRTTPVTCDNSNHYLTEQQAYDGGQVNLFPEYTACNQSGNLGKSIVMDYYDGNSVTALWNYAQNYALNDNAFGTTYGTSTMGALNVVSGLGGPMTAYTTTSVPTDTATLPVPTATQSTNVAGSMVNGQIIANIDPTYDDCSYSGAPDSSTQTAGFDTGILNVGNLLNTAGVTWGWFEGGFAPTVPYNPTTGAPAQCGESEYNVGGTLQAAYSTHYDPFQYFESTSNPHHLPPSSPSMIGYTDQANHQYDISDFWIAADSGNLPAVSYLKAPSYQTGHPSNSDPLDEQAWLVNTINRLESLPTWSSTAIVINWDDSDGYYDQVMPPIVSPSSDAANDALTGQGSCGTGTSPLGVNDRCGYGPRIPLLVISPYSKSNYVDSTLATQTAIVSFIEYNWNLAATTPALLGPESFDTMAGSIMNMFNFNAPQPGLNQVFLNPSTGEQVEVPPEVPPALGFGTPQPSFTNNGIPVLGTTSTCTDVDPSPDTCAIENNFGSGLISSSNYIWFSASADITTRESTATTLYFSGQWLNLQLPNSNGIPMRIPAPNAEVVFSSTTTTETTTFTSGQWVTTVPVGYTGNVFIGGVAWQLPSGVTSASVNGAQADWQGVFSGTTVSFTLNWQWAGGLYVTLGPSTIGSSAFYSALEVKPVGTATTAYNNNDAAGTPENFKSDYASSVTTGLATGATQYIGNYNTAGYAYYQAYLLNE